MIIKILLVLLTVESSLSYYFMTFGTNNPDGAEGCHGYIRYSFHKPDEENIDSWVARLDFVADVQIKNTEEDQVKSFRIDIKQENANGGNLDNIMRDWAKIKKRQSEGEDVPYDEIPERPPASAVVILNVCLDSDDDCKFVAIESSPFTFAFNESNYEEAWSNGALNESLAGPILLTQEDEGEWTKFRENYSALIQFQNENDYKRKAENFMEKYYENLETVFEHPSKVETVLNSTKIDVAKHKVAQYQGGMVTSIERVEKDVVVIIVKAHLLYSESRVLI